MVGDEAGAAFHAGLDKSAAQVHHAACQLLIAAGVKVDAQKACQLAVAALDEHAVGAHLLAVGGGGFKAQHIVLSLIHTAGYEGQHFVAQGRAQVAARQLAVGDGDDLVGVVGQLVQGDLIVGAQHVAEKVHDECIMSLQFLIHNKAPPCVSCCRAAWRICVSSADGPIFQHYI